MNKIADLHTHTNCSDGILTPDELLAKAIEHNITHISITDHDNIDGYKIALQSEHTKQIEIIPGIELSCSENQLEYHLLGYNFDIENKELSRHISKFRDIRIKRAKNMHNKLLGLGININFDDILEIAGNAPIARPHIAKAITTAGYAENYYEAFSKFIGDDAPAYEPKIHFPVAEAIKLIQAAGGLAVLAHPANFVDEDTLHNFIKAGLDGIEVVHPMHNITQRNKYRAIARKYNILQTGGSDFHGNRPTDELNFGNEVVSADVFYKILEITKSRKRRKFLFF
ncbi:MAG TPA: PHP domain-containing protein [Candidatus Kapabacteria bacterium]|jgi:predicted metal-dependent phosphoesterase TrpH|nr:PHP domain-containing protein [Candidatus Kapabacteria bacterium]HOM04619.1 PHP domain-containing protein [Candidatus Kapabacteria bacterium]HPU23730.1 PHP domain-containing protein [Candidatus Kapabacteria bacterium]